MFGGELSSVFWKVRAAAVASMLLVVAQGGPQPVAAGSPCSDKLAFCTHNVDLCVANTEDCEPSGPEWCVGQYKCEPGFNWTDCVEEEKEYAVVCDVPDHH